MARLDRHDTEVSDLPVSIDAASDELQSFVERQASEIIDAAVERAAQIERQAADRAGEVKREAESEAQEMLEEAFTRAWRILDGIDLLESGVGDMIGALRSEMEGFAADLGSASPAEQGGTPREVRRAAPSPDERPAPRDIERTGQNRLSGNLQGPRRPRKDRPVEDRPNMSAGPQDGIHAEVERMIIEQVAAMFRDGRSRADAERLLRRFKQGDRYLHVLDQVYTLDDEGLPPPSPPPLPQRGRRGFRLRRD